MVSKVWMTGSASNVDNEAIDNVEFHVLWEDGTKSTFKGEHIKTYTKEEYANIGK